MFFFPPQNHNSSKQAWFTSLQSSMSESLQIFSFSSIRLWCARHQTIPYSAKSAGELWDSKMNFLFISTGLSTEFLLINAELDLYWQVKDILQNQITQEKSEEKKHMNKCNTAWRSENNLHLIRSSWITRITVIVFMCSIHFEKEDGCCLLKGFLSWCKTLAINMPHWQKRAIRGGVKYRMLYRRLKLFSGIFEKFLLEKGMKITLAF